MSDKTLTQALADIIYRIDPKDARLAAAAAELGVRQAMDEYARADPSFAAEQRKARRELKAWRWERNELSQEIGRLTVPFVVVAINSEEGPAQDAACAVLKVTDWLFEHDAPADLMREFVRAVQHWIPE